MNTLLASSPTLTFKTYTMCTALALPKLLVHTGLGTSIKNFAAYHGADGDKTGSGSGSSEESDEEKARSATAERVKRIAGLVGVLLCVGIFFYLMHVARKAVDNLDDEAEDANGEKEASRGPGGRARMGSSSSRHGRSENSAEAERQRLYHEGDYEEDYDDEGSSFTDDSDFYSDDLDEDDVDEDDLPALDGGRAGDDSLASTSYSSHHKRPSYGRRPTSDGAEIDMRETGYDRQHGQWSSAGPSQHSAGPGAGIVGRVKAGLGLGSSASARYAPVPNSDGPDHRGGATAVQMSVVSSVSTPLTSVPASLGNGTVAGGRHAVVAPGPGTGLLGAKPRMSGVGERSNAFGPGGITSLSASPGAGAGRRSTQAPRLGPGMIGPFTAGFGGGTLLSPIAGTPNAAPSLAQSSTYGPTSSVPAAGDINTTAGASDPAHLSGTPQGEGEDTISMVDRIAEMEKSAEEYFTTSRPWNSSQTGTHNAAVDPHELRRLAQQQRRGGAGGPRSASEMGAEEARYGH